MSTRSPIALSRPERLAKLPSLTVGLIAAVSSEIGKPVARFDPPYQPARTATKNRPQRRLLISHQARQHIEVQVGEIAGREHFPGNCPHHGVVGA
ncbi:hypothetical protein ETAA8_55020 [Anatilimnocola aggregata]|uniref:Uncharacterized protein n=1 Tax=Anatilimnocola aggregata TaxID=2528021 RepID=A0A517YJH8_9BACT|nr:hypothetical protein ETAA8_55020 [Anatilimnocola aggregata]